MYLLNLTYSNLRSHICMNMFHFQVVIEESWNRGEQTIDVSKHFPGCPYIMNFCNMTQVRTNSGVVRPIRRLPQV